MDDKEYTYETYGTAQIELDAGFYTIKQLEEILAAANRLHRALSIQNKKSMKRK